MADVVDRLRRVAVAVGEERAPGVGDVGPVTLSARAAVTSWI
ncbi:hypothetical protein [Streptomyces sp. NPDC096132]